MTPFAKYFIPFVLIGAILFATFPVCNREDVNLDRSVNLKDVILSAKNIMHSAGASVDFVKNFRQFCSTVQVVADMKTIVTDDDDRSSPTQYQVFLLPPPSYPMQINAETAVHIDVFHGPSISFAPVLRPPLAFF